MPPTLTYPGVYIEELPSGVHTITGVATSIAAFVGWAPQGSVTEAVMVESWSDFAREFGGLSSGNYLGYAVNQFFANGGQQAYIVRLVATVTDTPTAVKFAATAKGIVSTLTLFASSPGQWGNNLLITVTPSTLDATRFSVQVQLVSGLQKITVENFSNLSVSPTDPEYVVTVIDNESSYITFLDPTITPPPPPPPPALPGAPASANLGTSTVGEDGDVLVPTDGNFELALFSLTGQLGINLLDNVDIFNLLCVPAETDPATVTKLQSRCVINRAFYIVDPPQTATVAGLRISGPAGTGGGTVIGPDAANAAYYFPWVSAPDPLAKNRPALYPPCGFVAGIYASTDASRGVWKAPAGVDAGLTGEMGLQYVLSDLQNGDMNIKAINCLREFKVYGDVVWGARTLAGDNQAGSQWKYVPIRRLALFLESSLYNGTQWVVFEPNDERLWSQIRMNVGAFMQGLFLQGAFQGTSPQQAYFVKCDAENNPQSSIDMGIVNILVGFAPLYPAEFVVIQIQQMAGQLQA
jgi:phage tail sheath protein FI